jgi:hypothetical protein
MTLRIMKSLPLIRPAFHPDFASFIREPYREEIALVPYTAQWEARFQEEAEPSLIRIKKGSRDHSSHWQHGHSWRCRKAHCGYDPCGNVISKKSIL